MNYEMLNHPSDARASGYAATFIWTDNRYWTWVGGAEILGELTDAEHALFWAFVLAAEGEL